MLWFTSSDALWSMFLVEDSCDEGFDVFEARPALRPCFFAVPSTEMLTDQDGQRGMSMCDFLPDPHFRVFAICR